MTSQLSYVSSMNEKDLLKEMHEIAIQNNVFFKSVGLILCKTREEIHTVAAES